MKESEIIELGIQCGYSADSAIALKDEASGRKYWRLHNKIQNFILCFMNPEEGDHINFSYISKIFHFNNIHSSRVLVHRPELGITIQSDLGDNDLLSVLSDENAQNLLSESLDLLASIQEIPNLNIPKLTEADLVIQMGLFNDVFCRQFLGLAPDPSMQSLIHTTAEKLLQQPWTNCHFDFERRNLLLTDKNKIAVIDYQDLCIGPAGIDLAGILLDHYYPIDELFVRALLDHYQSHSNLCTTPEEAYECFQWGGIQRNMRILGVLSKLYVHKGRDFRLKDLTMILSNLIALIPNGWSCQDFLIKEIQPALEMRLKEL